MDAGLIWTAAGTLGTCAALGVALAERRNRLVERRDRLRNEAASRAFGMPVAPPTGDLPGTLRGRAGLLRELRELADRPPGTAIVLTGTGGLGKSTVAAALADEVRAGRRRRVWWVSAADPAGLAAGMVTVARQLGAPPADLEAIALGAADAPDRLWPLLDRARRGWLLVLDNADVPEVLAAARPGGTGPGDGTGWIRPTRRGLILVTSRHTEPRDWGRYARTLPVEPLDEAEGAQVLRDLAPEAGDEATARALARRLGGLPLALHLAGTYLDSDIARLPTYAAYLRALDGGAGAGPLPAAEPTIMRTWEISLDDLARCGIPQARALLRLLSCYAPAVPVPLDLLDSPEVVRTLLAGDADSADRSVERGLRGLKRLALIETRAPGSVVVHPVISDVNRAHLDTADPDPAPVRRAAAGLLVAALAGSRFDDPGDWPRYRALGPHLRALLDTVAARLDRECLAELVRAVVVTARALDRSGAAGAGEGLCRAALDRAAELGDDHPVILSVRHQHAWEVASRGRHATAEEIYGEVLRDRRRVLGDDHPDTLASRHELAWIAACRERWAEAEDGYHRLLPDLRRVLGDDHPDTLTTGHELAWAIANQERFEEAETAFRRIHGRRRRVLGDGHPQTLATRHEIAWVTARLDRTTEAETIYREVLADRRRVLGNDHPDTLTVRHEIAWVTARLDRTTEAEAAYREVLADRRRVLGDDHPDTLTTRAALRELRHGRIVDARHLA
ncbi:hypothetical protein DPM19_14850 [Actinomadura craniellae]|uniref:Tetratricopeptide repeat protein n=1 Tax=Actinomadura craniellae TaxID=2231787 RepID=A0A365H584_9ACTN|nr:FxSxx-COOH system tetratricopeptide repeat protein [Actinomadura craniellae]RAY14255.1 hypothetical protein DPM19_14850 [Actinomadura craniellae]